MTILLVALQPFDWSGLRSTLQEEWNIRVVGEVMEGDLAIERAGDLRPNVILIGGDVVSDNQTELAALLRRTSPTSKIILFAEALSVASKQALVGANIDGWVTLAGISTSAVQYSLLALLEARLQARPRPGRELTVFVGYQFKSPYFRRTDFEEAVVEAIERAQADLDRDVPGGVRFRLDTLVLESGRPLNRQILDHIDRAHICVFELSDLNLNVFFELGVAVGRKKPCIYLLHAETPRDNVPSDLSGIYLVIYRPDTLSARLGLELRRRVEGLLQLGNEAQQRNGY